MQDALVNVIVTLQLFFADAVKSGAAPTAKRRKVPAPMASCRVLSLQLYEYSY